MTIANQTQHDGKKSLPLDLELYQNASSLPAGKNDIEFKKKPQLAVELIDRSLERGYRPGIVVIDAGYANNTTFLMDLEKRRLKYLGGLAKNRKVIVQTSANQREEFRLEKLAESLPSQAFTPVQLNLNKPKTLWVATVEVELSQMEGTRTIAIVMNASTFNCATDIDYLFTNVEAGLVTAEWVVITYAQRNWVEVFYREAKGWLGLSEYQVRDYRSLLRHFILVFCGYTFILWHTLTGGLRRRWANKPLNTFTDSAAGARTRATALEAFRTAMSYRFFAWLQHNRDVFLTFKASLGLIWA